MENHEKDRLRQLLSDLTECIPSNGGRMECGRDRKVDKCFFYGDRVAFMRLGLALFQYAIEAEIDGRSKRAEGNFLDGFFLPPSEARDLVLQIVETPV